MYDSGVVVVVVVVLIMVVVVVVLMLMPGNSAWVGVWTRQCECKGASMSGWVGDRV